MNIEIAEFVNRLSENTQFKNATNQYSAQCEEHEICTSNLAHYLEIMLAMKPKIILIGIAPGRDGCRLTGIPFTAEKNILEVYKNGLFFGVQENGFHVRKDQKKPQSEKASTNVWALLRNYEMLPLMWNVFPYHPHKPSLSRQGQIIKSNRTILDPKELEFGKQRLEELLRIFEPMQVVAAGETSKKALENMKIDSIKEVLQVSYPSNWKQTDFQTEFEKIYNECYSITDASLVVHY